MRITSAIIIATVVTALVAATVLADAVDDEVAETRQVMIDALEKAKEQEIQRLYDSDVVKHVYCEDTNSSFIVRRQLTDTQKRFIAIGRRCMELALAVQILERRVRELEFERMKQDKTTIILTGSKE